MSNLSEKELSALNDLLSEEELLVKKFQMLAVMHRMPMSVLKWRKSQNVTSHILTNYIIISDNYERSLLS